MDEKADITRVATKALVERALELTGWTPTEYARVAGLTPSTLTRFLYHPVKHTLSHRTITKLLEALPSDEMRQQSLEAGRDAGAAPAISFLSRAENSGSREFTLAFPTGGGKSEQTLMRALQYARGMHKNATAEVKPEPIDRHDMPRDVPVMGTAAGSLGDGSFELNDGEPVDFVRRGPGIAHAKMVYAIYVEGDSMFPWRRPGGLVYIDPARKPRIGDHVVVVMDGPEHGERPRSYLKRLEKQTAEKLVLSQYNPVCELVMDARRVKELHRVLEWEEIMGV
ncbi:peptidase S24-like protein [Acetobacteraceae bacterium AT-5844]|nr:peptidase S24-like protein [Acetobacteraceae bacterium AT-5844]